MRLPIYDHRTLAGYIRLITWLDIDYARRGPYCVLPFPTVTLEY